MNTSILPKYSQYNLGKIDTIYLSFAYYIMVIILSLLNSTSLIYVGVLCFTGHVNSVQYVSGSDQEYEGFRRCFNCMYI